MPLQFGLGSLLWLTLLVAILLGWHLDRQRLQRELEQFRADAQMVRDRLAAEKASVRALREANFAAYSRLKLYEQVQKASQETQEAARLRRMQELLLLNGQTSKPGDE